jgi:hypothetical protein
MNFRSPVWLLRKIEHARELGLIEDFNIVNKCEVDSFLTIKFHPKTPEETKHKLAKHIESSYEDIVHLTLHNVSESLIVQYIDWDILPTKVAF